MSDIIIHKGEQLTHEDDNSLYATALVDCYRHTPVKASDLQLADGTSPESNTPLPNDVFRIGDNLTVTAIHIGDSWRILSEYNG